MLFNRYVFRSTYILIILVDLNYLSKRFETAVIPKIFEANSSFSVKKNYGQSLISVFKSFSLVLKF